MQMRNVSLMKILVNLGSNKKELLIYLATDVDFICLHYKFNSRMNCLYFTSMLPSVVGSNE